MLNLALFTLGVYTPPLALYKDSCAGSMEATFVLLMAFSRSGTHCRRGKLRFLGAIPFTLSEIIPLK